MPACPAGLHDPSRRRAYSSRISSTQSCGPVERGGGGILNKRGRAAAGLLKHQKHGGNHFLERRRSPTRQPVIAYVLDRLLTRMVRARRASESDAGET